MLAYVLALVVGLGSLAIYLAAFFFPEIHRKNDFIWSGVGLFYALVLWIFAPRITGGLLLGHIASVALLVWFGWQALTLRRQVLPEIQQTPIPSTEEVQTSLQTQVTNFSLANWLGGLQNFLGGAVAKVKNWFKPTVKPTPSQKPAVTVIDKTTPQPQPPQAEKESEEVEPATPVQSAEEESSKTEVTEESRVVVVAPNPPAPELVEAAQAEGEEKPSIPVAEIAPDAVLAPPAEAPIEAAETQLLSPTPVAPNAPAPELVEAAQAEGEEKPSISVAEIAPDAILAPPAEAPVDQKEQS